MTINAPLTLMPLPDGRRVAVHRLAEGDGGRTIVLCHAAPGAGNFDPMPEETRARGVTLLAVDRPGYGQSDPVLPGAWGSVGAAADDLAAVLDQLAAGPVDVAGWSAGGRVALALAARRPDLVDRVAVLATPAPQEAVPWVPDEQQEELEKLRGLPPDEVHAALGQQLAAVIPADVRADEALALLGANPADEADLALPGARERLVQMLEAAYAQGAVGLAADIAGYALQPWGFAPEEVQAAILLLYGTRDPIVGQPHGSWWQQHLPHARLEMAPDVGHLLIFSHWARTLAHLAPEEKRRQCLGSS